MLRVAALALVVASCSAPRVCAPGETRVCSGVGSCAGLRVCDASGAAFGECTCGGGGGGSGGGSANAGGSTAGGAAGGGTSMPDAGCPLRCGSSCCRYRELCGSDGGCYSDFDVNLRPYCEPCLSGGGVATCGSGTNFCVGTGPSFCGVDCSRGQACAAGYACQDVKVVNTRWACQAANPACPADPSLPCGGPQDCARGVCTPQGQCAGVCSIRPGGAAGFCSCLGDGDCAQNACSGGQCTITRGSCVTEADCRPIRCVTVSTDAGSVGQCLIGQNCLPAPGLTCAEVG